MRENFQPNKKIIYVSTCLLVLLWILFTYLFFFGDPKWTYLSITLFWALPAILPQILFGADILWHYRKLVFWAILVPGTYLIFNGYCRIKGYNVGDFLLSDNRYFVLWNFAA